jgi:diacylglycerol kinase (ATP)
MAALVILNGISSRKKFFYQSILPELRKVADVQVRETIRAGHAEELAHEAARYKFDVVLAAGGDGTLHQVLNGLLTANSEATLGLIPLGTGNDFARSVSLKADGVALARLLKQNNPHIIDVGRTTLQDENDGEVHRYFINECSLGMGPDVVKHIQDEGASFNASFTYYKSIVKTFLTLPRPALHVKSAGWEWQGKACVFAVTNGKAFGHAVYIAPDANLADGQLNTFLAGDFPGGRFQRNCKTTKPGKKEKKKELLTARPR